MSDEIVKYTLKKIRELAVDERISRGTLAELRRGAGFAPGDKPRLWELLFEGMPESMMGSNGHISYEEWAIYTALTLYAIHQQGYDIYTEPMHCDGISLGRALSMMCGNDDGKKKISSEERKENDDKRARIKRRFDVMATADSMEGVAHYLRGLIQLLKAEGIALDYAMLAKDLCDLQIPKFAPTVRLRWGQDFYRGYTRYEGENKGENKGE